MAVKKKMACDFDYKLYGIVPFVLIGLIYMFEPYGVPTFGDFWSWIFAAFGFCQIMSNMMPKSKDCSSWCFPTWYAGIITAVGIWFVLGDMYMVPLFDFELLYVATLLLAGGKLLNFICWNK